MIKYQAQVYNKYDYTLSMKGPDYVFSREDGKGLAENVGR